MARWVYTKLRFLEPLPTPEQVERVRHVLTAMDYDFPILTTAGIDGLWRHPLMSLAFVLDALAMLGFPAQGYETARQDQYTGEWRQPDAPDWRRATGTAALQEPDNWSEFAQRWHAQERHG